MDKVSLFIVCICSMILNINKFVKDFAVAGFENSWISPVSSLSIFNINHISFGLIFIKIIRIV